MGLNIDTGVKETESSGTFVRQIRKQKLNVSRSGKTRFSEEAISEGKSHSICGTNDLQLLYGCSRNDGSSTARKRYRGRRILDLKDAEIHNVLRLLPVAKLNIVASDDVSAQ